MPVIITVNKIVCKIFILSNGFISKTGYNNLEFWFKIVSLSRKIVWAEIWSLCVIEERLGIVDALKEFGTKI
jgi:hypothetical protein